LAWFDVVAEEYFDGFENALAFVVDGDLLHLVDHLDERVDEAVESGLVLQDLIEGRLDGGLDIGFGHVRVSVEVVFSTMPLVWAAVKAFGRRIVVFAPVLKAYCRCFPGILLRMVNSATCATGGIRR
jgi:hypothetical protein